MRVRERECKRERERERVREREKERESKRERERKIGIMHAMTDRQASFFLPPSLPLSSSSSFDSSLFLTIKPLLLLQQPEAS